MNKNKERSTNLEIEEVSDFTLDEFNGIIKQLINRGKKISITSDAIVIKDLP